MIERTRSIDITAMTILIAGVVFIVAPIVIAFMTATLSYEEFVSNGGIQFRIGGHFFDNLGFILNETQLPRQLLNSVAIALMTAVIKCAVAFTATFALVFYKSRFNGVIFGLAIATVMLPLELIVITTYQIVANILMPLNWLLESTGLDMLVEKMSGTTPYFEWNLLDTWFGVAAPMATSSTSVFIYRQFFMSLPKDLPRAATMDGAGPIRFMIDILLPLSWTPLVATFMFWFIGGWSSYFWPLVAASTPEAQPAVVGLARMATGDPSQVPDVPMLMTGALFVSFIPVLLIALMQRQIVRGLNLSEK